MSLPEGVFPGLQHDPRPGGDLQWRAPSIRAAPVDSMEGMRAAALSEVPEEYCEVLIPAPQIPRARVATVIREIGGIERLGCVSRGDGDE